MNRWKFESFIYCPEGNNPLKTGYAQIPTPFQISEHVFRIFYSSRDEQGLSRPFYLDYDMDKKQVVKVSEEPVLNLGESGTFDDCGIMPSSVVKKDGDVLLYYIGWNQRKNISYQLAIGLAVSRDGGNTFSKLSSGPILDRNVHDPIFCSAPNVYLESNEFTMWYISCTSWLSVKEQKEPLYLIKRATSNDGINWSTSSQECIGYDYAGEAIGRPCVTKHEGHYHMIYSTRGSIAYREADGEHYRLGYAVSKDGIVWDRQDDNLMFELSGTNWDKQMQEYASVIRYKGRFYMFYNGNKFGQTGFGMASLLEV